MNRQDPSSTEQLLDMVRSSAQECDFTKNTANNVSTIGKLYRLAFKHVKLVIDIRSSTLCILAIEQKVAHPACERFVIPFHPTLQNNDAEVANFLHEKITFCTSGCKSVEIWTQTRLDNFFQTILEVSALKGQQLDKAVYWSLKKHLKELDEKTHFIDYRVRPSLSKDTSALQVEATVVPKTELARQKTLFDNAGLPLTGIVSKQCVVNAAINALPDRSESLLTLYVDKEFSCISIFTNNDLTFTRTIRTGTSSFIEALQGTEFEQGSENEFTPVKDSPYPNQHQTLFSHIEPVALRLARQIERTISLISNKAIPAPQRIYLTGDYAWSTEFKDFIERETNVETKTLPTPLSSELSLTYFDPNIRADAAFGLLYGTVLVEQNDGINLLHDFLSRRKLAAQRKIHLASTSVAIAVMLLLFISFCWQYVSNSQLQNNIATLDKEIRAIQPRLTQKILLHQMSDLENKRKQAVKLGENFAAPALLSMLNSMKTDNVRLIETHYVTGNTPLKNYKTSHRTSNSSVILDGIITGEPHAFNTALAMYIAQLGQSSFFSVPTVTLREQQHVPQLGTVLHFMLHCNLASRGE